ncbi:alpha/beta hydrolase [soil metagenome]
MSPSRTTTLLSGALALLPDGVVTQAMTHPPRRRRAHLAPRGIARRYDVTEVEVGGRRVATAAPRTGGRGRHLVHLHGGAYTLQDAHWPFLSQFVEQGWTVSLVDYPLAPEHTVADAVPMVVAAWQHVVAMADGAPVSLSGDSAGGGLAVVLLQRLRDLGLALPHRSVLLSPWVDLVMSDAETITMADDDVLLSLAGLRGAAELYSGGLDLADPWLSPINGDLHDLGEIQAWVSTTEMFLPQDRRLADLAAAASGTSLELRQGHGLPHDWALFPVPERALLVEEMLRFLS